MVFLWGFSVMLSATTWGYGIYILRCQPCINSQWLDLETHFGRIYILLQYIDETVMRRKMSQPMVNQTSWWTDSRGTCKMQHFKGFSLLWTNSQPMINKTPWWTDWKCMNIKLSCMGTYTYSDMDCRMVWKVGIWIWGYIVKKIICTTIIQQEYLSKLHNLQHG